MSRLANAVGRVAAEADLIIESLRFTRDKFATYPYPTYELKQQRLADIDRALAAVRSLRNEHRTNSKGES